MRKDFILMFAATIVTLLLALGLIRTFAPQLLGGPVDLQLVQLDEKMPAFYHGVFRDAGQQRNTFLLQDPLTRVRARPFLMDGSGLGPHDVLGFRNLAVPVAADIVTIGDSMTYGNNADIGTNWPAAMQDALLRGDVNVYNLSTGGWTAVQYLDMIDYARAFRPYVAVIAFYTGNDPLEALTMVEGNEHWRWLGEAAGITGDISREGLPKVSLDGDPGEQWQVSFADGITTVFTPQLRMVSNMDHPAVDAGYAIMASVAQLITERAQQAGVQPVFTIIPTKELVYRDKVEREGLQVPDKYRELVSAESGRLKRLAERIASIEGAIYVDVVTALQREAMKNLVLYPENINGHPHAPGYRVIGQTVAAAISGLLPEPVCGLHALQTGSTVALVQVTEAGVWYFSSEADIENNGWPEGEVPMVSQRQLLRLPRRGVVSGVDPQRFGPAACRRQENAG